jgi:hypothetical protein
MKIMASHSSATAREETPHVTETNRTITISDALRRRALAVINERSIDPQWRAVIRYALETNDPWLAELVRRADEGETIVDALDFSQTPAAGEGVSSEEKIEALTEVICRAGDEPAAALLVLMATLENATHPKALANAAKHLAFTRCADLNVFGMVDAQIAILEDELLAGNTLAA